MGKICYVEKKFSLTSLEVVEQANQILDAYQEEGFTLTLRQLYYQFVARGLLPNTQQSYKRLGSIVNDARLAGLIDWDHIQDRTRNVRSNPHWTSPGDIIHSAASSYGIDLWEDQEHRVEVWIEKDALIGVIEGVCTDFDVPFFACRGYVSQSELWSAAQRMLGHQINRQEPVVIHLGDHDPSGIDMTRDIFDRLDLMVGKPVEVKRIALNMDQVQQYNPPPNPAKITDSRAGGYIAQHGVESWELDALEPFVIIGLVKNQILDLLDGYKFDMKKRRREEEREELTLAANNWDDVVRYLNR